MKKNLHSDLSRRERQIMNVIYKHSNATVSGVLSGIPDPSSYSAIRTIMNILVAKGFLIRNKQGRKYVYSPMISQTKAVRSAVKQLLNTYFDNSLESAVSALLKIHSKDLRKEDFDRLKDIIDKVKKEGEE